MTTPVLDDLGMRVGRRMHRAKTASRYGYHPVDDLFAAMHPDTWDHILLERPDWRRLAQDGPRGSLSGWPRLPELGALDESTWVRLFQIPTFGDESMSEGEVRVWCSWSAVSRFGDEHYQVTVPGSHPCQWMQAATQSGWAPQMPPGLLIDHDGEYGISVTAHRVPIVKDPTMRDPAKVRFFCGWTPPVQSNT